MPGTATSLPFWEGDSCVSVGRSDMQRSRRAEPGQRSSGARLTQFSVTAGSEAKQASVAELFQRKPGDLAGVDDLVNQRGIASK
jgi:hypothetical protein